MLNVCTSGLVMSKPTGRTINANGINLNVIEQGEGPLVLLYHDGGLRRN